jgi:Glycosyl transferase family 11
MIITTLHGGLGNQMFQYAVGRALSVELNQSLRLNISRFNNYQLHNGFELAKIFAGPMNISSANHLRDVLGWRACPFIQRLLNQQAFSFLRGGSYLVEPHFHYWPEIRNASKDVILTGYWQSEKYFQSIESLIRDDFIFKLPMSEQNVKIASEMQSGNSVSLHVRRGDYLKPKSSTSIHALCSTDYYQLAIKQICERVENPKLFIFSDDISWVRSNLKIEIPCDFIDHNRGSESYNDMRLMGFCSHHIIANSSFSWWGAWLGKSNRQIVFYPKNWFNIPDYDVSDLAPSSWIPIIA